MFKIFSLIFLIFISFTSTNSAEINVFEFTDLELSKLEVRKVRGADNNTIYSVGSNENGNFLKGIADNAASGLGKKTKINLNKTPFINITWKIEKDLPGIKENTKKDMILRLEYLSLKKQEQHLCQIELLTMYFQVTIKLEQVHQAHTQKNQLIKS